MKPRESSVCKEKKTKQLFNVRFMWSKRRRNNNTPKGRQNYTCKESKKQFVWKSRKHAKEYTNYTWKNAHFEMQQMQSHETQTECIQCMRLQNMLKSIFIRVINEMQVNSRSRNSRRIIQLRYTENWGYFEPAVRIISSLRFTVHKSQLKMSKFCISREKFTQKLVSLKSTIFNDLIKSVVSSDHSLLNCFHFSL